MPNIVSTYKLPRDFPAYKEPSKTTVVVSLTHRVKKI